MSRENPAAEAHGGLQHWKTQRISAVLLIPLTLWLLWAIVNMTGADFTTARQFLAQPLNTVMAVLMSAVMFYHAQLGIQVVCEDYVYPPWLESALIWITRIGCLGGFAATLFAFYLMAPGA